MLRAAADSTVRRRVEPRSVARHVFGDHEIRMPCVSPRSKGARSGPLKAHEAEFLAGGGHGGHTALRDRKCRSEVLRAAGRV